MNFSRPLLLLSTGLLIVLPTMHIALGGLVLPLSQADINTRLQKVSEKSMYIQSPSGSEYILDTEDILQSVSVDSPFGETIPTSTIRLHAGDLLKKTAKKKNMATLIPEKNTLTLLETESGVKLPETHTGFGYKVSEELFEQILLAQIFSEDAKLSKVIIQVPVRAIEPEILLQKMDGTQEPLSVIAHGESNFVGSTPARVHNIQVAMNQFQGIRIDPGATFSFNDLLGEVDGSTGYKKELVIKGDRTIPDYGGGVCQVSSTVYRAALRAGFPIVERKPHSYAVSYYTPWGSDATIYPGVVDLQFTNNFATPVYMHLYIEGSQLHTLLYGTDDGRTIEMSGPTTYNFQRTPEPKVEYVTTLAPGRRIWKDQSHRGFSAYWDRTITSSTGSTMTERIVSTYEARGGFVLEGKAMEVPLQSE